jgi:hypothetical protein
MQQDGAADSFPDRQNIVRRRLNAYFSMTSGKRLRLARLLQKLRRRFPTTSQRRMSWLHQKKAHGPSASCFLGPG